MRTALPSAVPGIEVDPPLQAHLAALRLDPRSVNPAGWRVDWDDGPWPVTVRTGGTRLALRAGSGDPLLERVDGLLRGTFAMGRVRFDPRGGLPATPEDPFPRRHGPRVTARRPIPSGGSMYPTEAYLLLTGPDRLYHHDPYRHELIDLAHPAPSAAVRAALGGPPPAPVVLVLTLRFWKNFYKYGDFAFRLGAVDVGVALGRALRLGTAGFGRARVCTDVDDGALGACLGVDPADEGPYAVLELGAGTDPDLISSIGNDTGGSRTTPAVVERSRRIRRSPRFAAAHAAACRAAPAHHPSAARPGPTEPARDAVPTGPAVVLPSPIPVDLLEPGLLARRTSNGRLFRPDPVDVGSTATLLAGTAAAVRRLSAAAGETLGGDVVLFCAVQRVSGVAPGWYRHRQVEGRDELVPVGAGPDPDVGRVLQSAMFADSVNVELAAFTVHVGAGVEPWLQGRGVRGYREQQLAIGASVEALTLLAAAVGLGSHPVLGFDVAPLEAAYGLRGTGTGVHAQVSVGPVRPDLNWEITVVAV